ncbi:MAG TPA: hypothetical protein VGD17_02455 [Chitinophagaceae bacterium]
MKAVLGLIMLCSVCAYGQRRVDVDANMDVTLQPGAFFTSVNGIPAVTNIYYRVVDGTAFFRDEWLKGSVSIEKGREYQNLTLKLDLLENTLYFKDGKGNEMVCTTPVNGISLKDPTQGKVFRFAHIKFIPALAELKLNCWLEVLANGPVQLYSQYKKTVSESRPYGQATLEQRILTTNLYYLVIDNRMVKVKRIADIAKALPSNQTEIQAWLKANNVEDKNPSDFARLVDWYNGLTAKN